MSTPIVDPVVAAGRYRHGTHARYALGKCRCFECKVAHSDYVFELNASRAKPYKLRYVPMLSRWDVRSKDDRRTVFSSFDKAAAAKQLATLNRAKTPKTDNDLRNPSRARKHLAALSRAGIGYKTVSKRAGLGCTAVAQILSGETKRIRRETEQAILGVAIGDQVGSTNVDAGPTWKLLDELIAAGYRKAHIATALGRKTPALQIRRDRVQARTASAVRALHARLLAPPPAPTVAVGHPPSAAHDALARALSRMEPDEFFIRLSRLELVSK